MRFVLVLALFAAGCSVIPGLGSNDVGLSSPPQTLEEYRVQREVLVDQLDEAIGRARATNVAACRVVPVGEKACGGPAGYRVYSASDVAPGQVTAAAEEVTRLDAYANERFEMVSTCDVTPEPSVTVVDGRCVASGW